MRNNKSYSLEVRMHTGSSNRSIEFKDNVAHIYTNVKPIDGKANQDAFKIISKFIGVPRKNISIIKGEKSRNKVFKIEGAISIDKIKFLSED